ncbi:hypothetical protein [Staphylococcus schweitzeri]|uniref:Uncharacterized protein n=1 Tax=Staphylococcus schweitzeri TaxID=1654388 RepID=A0A077UHE5_9STAP|nr:hypothetical protein [Staphylococcus schweitzeri]CDR26473.1 hypothetical protein ERS140147_00017 [Staphylococcus schweitzeri]
MCWEKFIDIINIVVPFLTVLISFLLGSYTSRKNFNNSFKKDTLLKFHNEVLYLCYSLPNQEKIDYQEILSFYGEDMFSKVISKNLIYMDKSRVESWSKFNYCLQVRKDPSIPISIKDKFLKPLLNYYSAQIILQTLEESKSIEDELKLFEISKHLLSKTSKLTFYRDKLPPFEEFEENNYTHLFPKT